MRFIALLAFALASASAAAQDLPGRVGRVSYTDGPVAVYQDPDIGWERAYVNSPLTSQNSLWTEPGARAELRVSAVAIRLEGATQLDVSRLDDDRMDAALVRGSVAIRIRHNDYASRFAFDTPEARFILTREGRYRIDVDTEAQQTRLAVFDGEASMETSEGVRRIPRGRMVVIADGNFAFDQVYRTDFDAWTVARDREWVERRSTRYVSTFMTGYEELDPYGEWIEEPGYGALWVPTQVATDWVPYRFGHWSYVRPWGWTWIDDQPWGYAPFHYGRWVHVRERWCWYPGRREARPAWAPALVAWVGGSNFSVAVGGGSPVMGWYPLAPTERYQPWYHANDHYVSRVNNIVINNITINNDNRRFGEDRRPPQEVNRALAVTAVPRENLIERRPVQQSMVRVATDVARSAPVVQPQNVVPNNTEIQRMRAARAQTAPPSVAAAQQAAPSMPQATPQAAPQGQPAARGNAAIGRGERTAAQPGLPLTAPQVAPGAPVAPAVHPNFARPEHGPVVRGQAQSAPAPAPAAPQAAPQPAPQGNPLSRGRGEQAQQERAQQQQEAQRPAQEQRRSAEAQQREAQRQQQQQQQREQQPAPQGNPLSRSRGEQAQQERAQQQEAQRQAQEQRRAAEAQQREAQRQQQLQQQAQQRQQQEAQRQQREQQLQQAQAQAQRQQAAPQPQQQQGGNPLARGGEEHRGRPHGQEDNDDNRGGARR